MESINTLEQQQQQLTQYHQEEDEQFNIQLQKLQEDLQKSQQRDFNELFQYLKNEEKKINESYSQQMQQLKQSEENHQENKKQLIEYFHKSLRFLGQKHQSEQEEFQEICKGKNLNLHDKQKIERNKIKNPHKLEEKRKKILRTLASYIATRPSFLELKDSEIDRSNLSDIMIECDDVASEIIWEDLDQT